MFLFSYSCAFTEISASLQISVDNNVSMFLILTAIYKKQSNLPQNWIEKYASNPETFKKKVRIFFTFCLKN